MRHHGHVRNHGKFARECVRKLPDGRRLITELDQQTKVVDREGNEIMPSRSEIAALTAVSEMQFPGKFRLEDWSIM